MRPANWLFTIPLRLRSLFRWTQADQELDDELRDHLERKTEEYVAQGMPQKEAHRRARLDLDGIEQTKEKCRDERHVNWIQDLIQDLRVGLRVLRKNPGFTATVILTMALGLGANTAIFTLIDAVMLKSLPVTKPSELYRLGDDDNCCVVSGLQGDFSIFSYALYEQLRDHTPEFSELAAFQAQPQPFGLRWAGASAASEPYVTEVVSGNYFQMFGVTAAAGRLFLASDDTPGAPPTAVLSYRAWRDHFGLDPSAINSTVMLNGLPVALVGVAPEGFYGDTLRSDPPDLWLPLTSEPLFDKQRPLLNDAAEHWLYLIGRLRAGAQPAHVQAEVTVELQRWLREKGDIPANESSQIAQQKLILAKAGGGIETLSGKYAEGFRMLTFAAGLVLLIACANIAGLVLAQGTAARLPTAIRVALGASRVRLIRQTLTEGLLLACFGGAASLFVAYAGARGMLALAFRGARYVPIETMPSLPVIAFAFAISLLTGLSFAAIPSLIMSKVQPAEALRGAGRSRHDRTAFPRKALVVLQTALSLTLLVAAGLLIFSLRRLENQPFGFRTEHRVFVKIDPFLAGYTPERLAAFYQVLAERLKDIPAVESASFSLYSPMEGLNWSAPISIEGHAPAAGPDNRTFASWNRVSAHYFETIGTRLLRGRTIDEQDTPKSRHVTVINETFARKFFPNEDPLGKHLGLGDANHSLDFEVVGIVEDAKYLRAREAPWPTFFLPLLQMANYSNEMEISMQLRSNYIRDIELLVAGHPQNLEGAIRKLLGNIAPDLTVLSVIPFGEQLERNFNQERLIARLTTLFGLLALFLACIGLYGVLAHSVVRRTNEIGIRMALGAGRWKVLRMILREAAGLALLGVAIGVLAALAVGRLLASLLYDLKPSDPLTIMTSAAVLLAVAGVAALWPAYRAARVDPMVALRHE
jgi:predicted permease